MAINTELLLRELRHVTIQFEEHDQGLWLQSLGLRPTACGSTGCLAGNAVLHAGVGLRWYVEGYAFEDPARDAVSEAYYEVERVNKENDKVTKDSYGYQILTGLSVQDLKDVIMPKGVVPNWIADNVADGRPISYVARDLLGLEFDQAESLFNPDNDVHDLWDLAIEFTEYEPRPITDKDMDQAFAERDARCKKLEASK